MRRILPLTLLALTLVGGVASADHYRRGGRGGGGGVVVRDHRTYRAEPARPVVVRQRRAVVRAPVYVSNGP